MDSLQTYIARAEKEKIAIAHFNFCTIDGFRAIVSAAKKVSDETGRTIPVIVGVSEGERDYTGVREAVALVNIIRERDGYPVFLNADHSYSLERVKEAVDAGFDAVIFDGAKLPIGENIRIMKECVFYAHSKNPDILMEGELGYIGTSSKLLDEVPEGVSLEHLTTADEAKRFVSETGVDLFSPSVGNIHGMLRNAKNPRLNIERIREIREVAGAPLVLHGGSGISDEDFTAAIKAGISIIHINTELRKGYRDGLESFLKAKSDELAPYRYLSAGATGMEEVAAARIRLFNKI
ncbi:MAG: class II fructose-bisphosphate aldolase [Patescibacteria group bacterium]|mgnify:FL=1